MLSNWVVEYHQVKLPLRILTVLLGGVVLCAASSIALYKFITNEEYNSVTFTGLVFFTFLSTPGAGLTYVGLMGLLDFFRREDRRITAVLLLIPTTLFLIIAFLSVGWAAEVFKCGWIFCLASSDLPAPKGLHASFKAVTGSAIFFATFPVGLAILAAAASTFVAHSREATFTLHSYSPPRIAVQCAGFFLMVLFMFFVCTILPNAWDNMTGPGIAAFIAKGVECNAGTNCPELPDAYFVSTELVIKEGVMTMKFFPSTLFFYGYLFFCGLVTSALLMSQVVRTGLKRRLWVFRYAVSVGEVVGCVGTAGMVVIFFTYWIQSHNFNHSWKVGMKRDDITESERWGRAFGQLAVVMLSLLLIPASRHSFLHSFMGTSFGGAHRVLGYGMLLSVLAHAISWFVRYNEMGRLSNVFDIPNTPPYGDNFTVLATVCGLVLLVCMGVFTLPVIRRRFFELFYYAHLFAAYATIPVVLYHASAGWEYMLPGLTIWFMDRVSRVYRSATPATVCRMRTFEKVATASVGLQDSLVGGTESQLLELHFTSTTMKSAKPGDHVFINIPGVSLLEWHPFTVSSYSPEEATYSVHMRSMGPNTWTSRAVRNAREALQASGVQGDGQVYASGPEHAADIARNFLIKVDGPYGQAHPLDDYEQVILIAGGIGVTPCAALLQAAHRHDTTADFEMISSTGSSAPKISLLWSLRDGFLVDSLSSIVGPRVSGSKNASTQSTIYCTGTSTISNIPDNFKLVYNRPDYSKEIEQILDAGGVPADRALVFVCGPPSMVDSALSAAMALGCHFHSEVFEM